MGPVEGPGGLRLELLYEVPGLPAYALPEALARAYGGTLGFPEHRLFGNFVASIDGVVALHREDRSPGSTIGGDSEADRVVMGLLRACWRPSGPRVTGSCSPREARTCSARCWGPGGWTSCSSPSRPGWWGEGRGPLASAWSREAGPTFVLRPRRGS